MKKTISFYAWFIALGGNVAKFEVSNTAETFNEQQQNFSFKQKAKEVKKQFNHKFNL